MEEKKSMYVGIALPIITDRYKVRKIRKKLIKVDGTTVVTCATASSTNF